MADVMRLLAEEDRRCNQRRRRWVWATTAFVAGTTAFNVWLRSPWFLLGIPSLVLNSVTLRINYRTGRRITETLEWLDERRSPSPRSE